MIRDTHEQTMNHNIQVIKLIIGTGTTQEMLSSCSSTANTDLQHRAHWRRVASLAYGSIRGF
jgi:hypothetical protein